MMISLEMKSVIFVMVSRERKIVFVGIASYILIGNMVFQELTQLHCHIAQVERGSTLANTHMANALYGRRDGQDISPFVMPPVCDESTTLLLPVCF